MIPARCALFTRSARTYINRAAVGAVLALCLVGALRLLTGLTYLSFESEVGYGDSYILYDVQHFQKTGVIYRDTSQPPYLPSLYSPMLYVLYSLPGRTAPGGNPFIGPRLIALSAFLLAVALAGSIARTLIPARSAWWWSVLLVCSMTILVTWFLHIRGDFPAICCSLTAIRLLLSRSRWAAPLAGLSAGFAVQFKVTFIAALVAGTLWLLSRRRWRDAGAFVSLGALAVAVPYLLFALHEPRMLAQILTLGRSVPDVRGCLQNVFRAVREPVALLALLALPPVQSRGSPRWNLVLLFALTSFTIAVLTDLQAGGNVNYFYEALLALIPFAVLGTLRLSAVSYRHAPVGLLLVALFSLQYLLPATHELYERCRFRFDPGPGMAKANNEAFKAIARVLRERHFLSLVPQFSLLDPTPALMEPFLLSYMQRLGTFDPRPLVERTRNTEFDVVVTYAQARQYRRIPLVAPSLRDAIAAAYKPQCVIFEWMVHLPRSPRPLNRELAARLAGVGCEPPPDRTEW